jgi:hypothetical protein
MPLFFRVTALGVDVPLDETRLQNARQWRRARATFATLRFAQATGRAARCSSIRRLILLTANRCAA